MKKETAELLRRPFGSAEIGKLPKVTCKDCSNPKTQCQQHQRKTCRTCKAYISIAHIHIDYVGHAHVRERLLKADPEWSWEPMGYTSYGTPYLDDNGGLWIKLTVDGTTKLGYGDATGKRGGDAVKEAIGDALRNAAQSFGVALDLWKKEKPEPASEPAREQPREQPTLTPEQRATELRKLIAAIGKKAGKGIQEIGTDFYEWSQGTEITRASVKTLEDYRAYLEQR